MKDIANNTQCSAILEHLKKGLSITPLEALEFMECVREAAARLRERHKEPFNHEAFNL